MLLIESSQSTSGHEVSVSGRGTASNLAGGGRRLASRCIVVRAVVDQSLVPRKLLLD